MLNWDDFQFMLALDQHRSLKDAAQALDCDQATVGRKVYALEDRLGVQLFEKRSDGFFLTSAGERILPTLKEIEASFQGIDRKLTGQDERPAGRVRVAMPGALANHWLIPRLGDFFVRHPAVDLEFLTGPEVLNLARREADLAIRLVRPQQRDLVIKKLGEMELALYAPTARKGSLPFIALVESATSQAEATLLKRAKAHTDPVVLRSSAWHSVYCAVAAGLGMGILPSFLGDSDTRLKRVREVAPERMTLWMVVHPDVQTSARVKAVMEFVSGVARG